MKNRPTTILTHPPGKNKSHFFERKPYGDSFFWNYQRLTFVDYFEHEEKTKTQEYYTNLMGRLDV